MKTATLQKNKIILRFPYDMATIQLVRSIEGRKWDDKNKYWTLPSSAWHAQEVIDYLQPHGFEVSKEIHEMASVEAHLPDLDLPVGLYPFQQDAVKFLYAIGGRAIIADEMGLGKAQPLDAKLLTPTGWITMGEVQPGDYIRGKDNYVKVNAIYPRGYMDVYKIVFSDGSETECTLDHLWEVSTPNWKFRGRKSKVMSLEEILKNGIKDKAGNRKFFIPLISTPLDMEQEEYNLDPYVLGVLLGDGGIKYTPTLTSEDSVIINYVSHHLPEGLSLKHAGHYDYRITKTSGNRSGKNPLVEILKELGLYGKGSKDKFVPENYLYGSWHIRLSVLKGLLDTDGWVDVGKRGNHTSYCTTSRRLADDVVFIVRSLGGTARIRRKENKYEGAWVVSISLPSGIQPFYLPRKAELHNKERTKYEPTRSIEDVYYVGKKKVQCISVDSPDGLYVTDDLIVTHNTIEALAYASLGSEKILIISPSNVLYKWEAECKKWMPKLSVAVYPTGKGELGEENIHILSYGIMVSRFEQLKEVPYDLMIFDEAHLVKNSKAMRTRVTKALVKTGVPGLLFLSGTPFMNRPAELFTLVNMIDPKGFPNFYSYATRYCAAVYNSGVWYFPPNGVSNIEELSKRLESIMIRRTKRDVLKDLPDLTRTSVPVEIDNLREYKSAVKDIRTWLSTQKKELISPEHALTRLNVLRQIVGKGKVTAAIELAESVLNDGKKVVLFAHHKEVVAQLETVLAPFGVGTISGSVPAKKRQQLVDEFLKYSNDSLMPYSSMRVMIITVAGAEGIDLYSASDIIFVEREWTPAKEEQAESRLHRNGQKNPVNAWYIVATGTVDEKFDRLVKEKRKIFSQVIKTDEILELLYEE
jgi:superfamily II DNA or RNA helicase